VCPAGNSMDRFVARRMHRKAEEEAASSANGDDENAAKSSRGPRDNAERSRAFSWGAYRLGAEIGGEFLARDTSS
jgi:hypothetical protein